MTANFNSAVLCPGDTVGTSVSLAQGSATLYIQRTISARFRQKKKQREPKPFRHLKRGKHSIYQFDLYAMYKSESADFSPETFPFFDLSVFEKLQARARERRTSAVVSAKNE